MNTRVFTFYGENNASKQLKFGEGNIIFKLSDLIYFTKQSLALKKAGISGKKIEDFLKSQPHRTIYF